MIAAISMVGHAPVQHLSGASLPYFGGSIAKEPPTLRGNFRNGGDERLCVGIFRGAQHFFD
jgi:hypothetical protein